MSLLEPLATAGSREQLEELGHRTFKHLKAKEKASGWEQCFHRKKGPLAEMRIWSMPYPRKSSALNMYKGITVVPDISPARLQEEIWNLTDARRIREFDDVVRDYRVLEEVHACLRVDHCQARLPWPVWNRHVTYAIFRSPPAGVEGPEAQWSAGLDLEEGRKCHVWAVAVRHRQEPQLPVKTLQMRLMGYFGFEALPGHDVDSSPGTRITRIIFGDPAGSMPAWLVRRQAQTQAQGIVDWIEKTYAAPRARY